MPVDVDAFDLPRRYGDPQVHEAGSSVLRVHMRSGCRQCWRCSCGKQRIIPDGQAVVVVDIDAGAQRRDGRRKGLRRGKSEGEEGRERREEEAR